MFEVNHVSGMIELAANPTTKNGTYREYLNIRFGLKEWAKIRIECYINEEKPITKVFMNGELKATSNSFFISDAASPDGLTQKKQYGQARFFALRAVDATVCFDNLFFDLATNKYTDSTTPSDAGN